ncbi:hypothetical protein QOZ80_9BG0700640 [Eleusine coracana subsp. coracana]|nr:hypothetical protein QOZ80_9BG0700640 [Eleusine coracana subsp. coracana]
MDPSREANRRRTMDTEDGEDRLSSLPEGLLEDILFYLPSRDAVRTSVLARRWRTVWKSVRALRVMESESYQSANELNGFVNNMLLLRETLPLNVVEIKSYHESFDEDHNFESLRYIEHWVRSDCCDKSYEIGDCGDNSCKGCPGSTGNSPSILLQGLSCAANLELTAKKTVFVFRRDLTRCPIFSKLKTLLLNGWCLTRNFDALVCFLQHSPALEKLILQLPEIPEDLVPKVGIYGVKKQSSMMNHLTVEIKCCKPDVRIGQIVEVLSLYGIPPRNIMAYELPKEMTSRSGNLWPSGSLSFEQKRT